MARIAVMGAGSWGTAFALVLADAGNDVTMWGRRAEVCDAINATHENPDYLAGIELPSSIAATPDASVALEAAEMVVLAVPSQQLRPNLEAWAEHIPERAILISLMKGVELGTHLRMSEVVASLTGAGPERIAVVSGPNLAREIALREPAASVVACEVEHVAQRVQQACHTASFRPYTNTDVIGCELAGTTKNVIGLAVGVAVGLGYGDNSKASIITRGLAEAARLGVAIGADPQTFMGLAGMGDLVATCSSPLSRNRSFGEKLGTGMTVEEATSETRQVAEGVKSCRSLSELAAMHGVEMPIVEHVAALIAGTMSPAELVDAMIARKARPE